MMRSSEAFKNDYVCIRISDIDPGISDSKQVLNKPVPDITARCGSTGELLDPGRITLEKDNKTRCILEHVDRNDHRCGMDASGLTDIVEAVYPVVVVTYGVGIIVSLMTYKEKK